jgi:hypothetical protein
MAEKKKDEAPAAEARALEDIRNLARRVDVNEDRINSLRNHLDLIDRNLIEKNKNLIENIKRAETDIRLLRKAVSDMDRHLTRMVQRLEEFAPKDRVLVLERYINMWSPLQYITRKEVNDLISKRLGEQVRMEET